MDRYTYRVTWSEEDQEYVGLCAEFPSLSWLDENQERAFSGIKKAVQEVIQDMKKNKDNIPEPLALKKFSGKFMVRVPGEIHRKLALSAAEQGVSLNRLVSNRLAS